MQMYDQNINFQIPTHSMIRDGIVRYIQWICEKSFPFFQMITSKVMDLNGYKQSIRREMVYIPR